MVKKYVKTGVGLIGANIVVGSIPNVSGTTGETNVKSKFAEGMGNMGKALPSMGKVAGTKMVLKPMKNLKKTKCKFKLKGAYKL